MIKGIFCHDLPIYKDINGVYCSTTLTNDVFSRYLSVVDDLVIATRVYPIDTTYIEAGQERIDIPSIRFIDLPNVNTPTAFFGTIQKVKKILKDEIRSADLVFIRGGTIALISVQVAKELNKAYLLECGGSAWDSYWYHSLIGKILAPYMEVKNRMAAKNAAMVVYVTKKWLQKRYPTKGLSVSVSDVLIDSIDFELIDKRLKHIESGHDGQFVLGTTAAIDVKYKGQEYVINAMKMLKDISNIRYEIVGGGDPSRLQRIAEECGVSEKVVFKGQLTHNNVLKWLDNIDVYIQPSITEGLPRALIEAMSRGCPAIGSDVGGIPELLDQEFLFKKKDSKGLVEILKQLSKEDLKKAAVANYTKTKEFGSDILNGNRILAFQQYKKRALGD